MFSALFSCLFNIPGSCTAEQREDGAIKGDSNECGGGVRWGEEIEGNVGVRVCVSVLGRKYNMYAAGKKT